MENKIFETQDVSKINEITPLVSEPYTYENIVQNPIIKPISEADKNLRSIFEIMNKKLLDAKRIKEEINSKFDDNILQYQTSTIVSLLMNLISIYGDIIKFHDMRDATFESCIKDIAEQVRNNYAIKSKSGKYEEPKTIIPEGSVSAYLDKVCENNNPEICLVAQKIKELFPNANGKTEKEKLEDAGITYYKTENDKNKRQITGRIVRMEI